MTHDELCHRAYPGPCICEALAERDAKVRAEVARLGVLLEQAEEDREKFDGERLDAVRELRAARAEVAALREQTCAHDMTLHDEKVRREVLADLRARVEGLGTAWSDSGGYSWVRRDHVLALIEETQHD